jgi:hypothetical protein
MDVMSVAVAIKETGAKAVESALDKLGQSATEATSDLKKMDGMLGGLGSTLAGLAASIGAAAIFQRIAAETVEAEFATAQLNAALKSTRGVSGQTVEALAAHASALQQLSIYDDDVIAGAQAMLLTFTRIHGDTFPKATEAVLNVAQAMGTDLKSAAIQVGKALNDPILGVSALARSGIQFTEAQREMIKQMVETNRLAEAQRIILAELETQFGGSAKAARDTFGGALQSLQNDIGNALTLTGQSASLATQLVNYFGTVVRGLRTVVDNFVNLLGLVVTTVTGTLRILKAMQLAPEQYAARYAEITAEMSQALETFRGGFDTAKQAGAAYKDAATYFGALRTQTEQASSAFGIFSGRVFGATTAVRNFLAGGTGGKPTTEKPKPTKLELQLAAEEAQARRLAPWLRMVQQLRDQMDAGEGTRTVLPSVGRDLEALLARTKTVGAEVARTVAGTVTAFQVASFEGIGLGVSQAIAGLDAKRDEMIAAYERNVLEPAREMGNQLGQILSAGVANAFQALTAKGGNIGDAFKALGQTVLSGLGDMLIQVGTKGLAAAIAVNTMLQTLFSPTGIAASLAVIALGGALKGVASRMTTTGAGAPVSSGGFGYTAGGQGGITLPGLTFGPTMAAAAAGGLSPMQPMNVTIIGPNDPSAQRQMQELLRNAQRRGGTTIV